MYVFEKINSYLRYSRGLLVAHSKPNQGCCHHFSIIDRPTSNLSIRWKSSQKISVTKTIVGTYHKVLVDFMYFSCSHCVQDGQMLHSLQKTIQVECTLSFWDFITVLKFAKICNTESPAKGPRIQTSYPKEIDRLFYWSLKGFETFGITFKLAPIAYHPPYMPHTKFHTKPSIGSRDTN